VEFDEAVARLDDLVQAVEREGDERALTLLELVDAIHRPALALLAAGEVEHPAVQALLAMYDLAPPDDQTLVEEGLDRVRPYIHSHGGEVELLGVEDGVVHLRLSGACHGCAASAMTLRRGIEETLRAEYPAFRGLVAHDPEPGIASVAGLRRPVFVDAARADQLTSAELLATVVEDVPVLLVNVAGEIYAFRNGCAVDGLPLEGGRLADTVLVCPWHNCAYDARTGKRVDDAEAGGLRAVPIAIQHGAIRVAVNVA